MYKIIVSLLLLIMVFSCAASKEEIERKIDPLLLAKVLKLEETGRDNFFQFTGICEVELSYEMRNEIEYTGARIEKYSKNLFTAIGTSVHIKRTAQLSFVNYIKENLE